VPRAQFLPWLSFFALLTLFIPQLQAEEATPVEKMLALAKITHLERGLAMQVALSRVEDEPDNANSIFSEYDKGLTEAQKTVEDAYRAAKRQVAKNPTATSLLKDYFAQWNAAVKGLWPDPGESRLVYQLRKQKAAEELDRLAERLKLELE
jgi:hypothetical protein